MAASDEFPRGLILTNQSTGAIANVTYPAVPGISWILTAVNASIVSNTSAGAFFSDLLTFFNGIQQAVLDVMAFQIATAGEIGKDTASFSGQLQAPQGESLSIQTNAPVAGRLDTILASAYAI